jgi:hypothetical protein
MSFFSFFPPEQEKNENGKTKKEDAARYAGACSRCVQLSVRGPNGNRLVYDPEDRAQQLAGITPGSGAAGS